MITGREGKVQVSSSRLLDLEIDVATLRRRVEALEAHTFGRVSSAGAPHPLFSIYAHLLCDGVTATPDSAALLRSVTLLLTPRSLLDLGRMAEDPFPWRPFLLALDHMEAAGHEVQDALSWVHGCAEELLRAQGLSALKPADVLMSPVGPLNELRQFNLSGN